MSLPAAEGADRRIAKRKKSRVSMKYRLTRQKNRPAREAVTVDISSIAVLFESKEIMSIGTEMQVELDIPALDRPVIAEGWVNRIEEVEGTHSYHYSVVFNIISHDDQVTLEKFVQLMDIDNLLRLAVREGASDIHFIADHAPVFRINGKLTSLDLLSLPASELHEMIMSMLTQNQQQLFLENLELDFSYLLPEGVRFRVNIHKERGNMEAALRLIPTEIKTIEQLGLPQGVHEFAKVSKGLIVISGPTGSGKTTTLAALLDEINRTRNCMVISIEDPIEYVHESKKSIIKQREVGADTKSFANALKHVLRQDPDVILVGEIRDLESISMAITAAETGHLVLTTLHTSDASECVNRIVDVYPSAQQSQVRSQLSGCLEGILVQMLLPRMDRNERILATELLIATPAIRSIIREGKLGQLCTYLESGSKYGMHTLDSSLVRLVKEGKIEEGLARGYAKNPKVFGEVLLNA
jgi:twitching motility protein PilT